MLTCTFCKNQFSVFYCSFHYVRPGFPKHALLVCLKRLFVISLACSRLRDSGEKSFSKKKCKKRAGAGERQGGGASLSHFSGRHRPLSQVARVLFSLSRFNTSALYYLRAWHRLSSHGLAQKLTSFS